MARSKIMQKKPTREKIYLCKKYKEFEKEPIDKSSLIYIYTSEWRYWPKGSVLLVSKQKFNENQLQHLSLSNNTKSIDSNFYIYKACTNALQKNIIPPC